MTTSPLTHPLGLTPQQYARLREQAKEEAAHLRREAIDALFGSLADAARSAIGALRHALSACAPSRWPAHRPPSSRQTTARPST
jgi:hypothetical protein